MNIRFSKAEIIHLIVSTIALAFAFSLVLYRGEIFPGFSYKLEFFINSLVIVGFAFILHEELGHKIVAQRYGCWAEYRAWPTGLLFAVLLAFITKGGFVFAAPGAVMISTTQKTRYGFEFTHLAPDSMGKIAIAGSVVNIILAIIFSGLTLVFTSKVLAMAAVVNVWLALFNMIPFGPLDGAKVFKWDKRIWGAMLGICAVMLFLVSQLGAF